LVSVLPTEDDRLSNLLRRKDSKVWLSKVESVGGCAKPVRLAGTSRIEDTTGTVLRATEGTIFTACNNRRETVCPACADRYATDTFHLVRCGLTGGKDVPESVTGHVRAFVTLTAAAFGAVHNRPTTRTGQVRRCRCGEVHHEQDPRVGTAVDPTGYDYVGAVLWNAHAPELWRRFTITCARHLAAALGIRPGELRSQLRLSYVKVGEYQRRGLIHFHAVVRIDGPTGPDSRPPASVTPELLCQVARTAAAAVRVDTPDSDTVGTYTLGFGPQVDAEPIAAHDPDDPTQLVHDRQVAGYVAKYATKGTGLTTGADHTIRRPEQIPDLPIADHHKTMIATAWRLGGLPEFAGLNLRKWAHMLGFRGHFLTKSRRYSTTFTALRAARGRHRLAAELDTLGITDTDTIVVINDWSLSGIGYHTDAERELAAAIATKTLDRRRLAGQDQTRAA
jgi:hypothetical protein